MTDDHTWMQAAISEARSAVRAGEIPIGSVLVAREDEVARSQTQVKRRGLVAHGESMLLLNLAHRIYSLPRPIVLYTNVEPCVMCLGACMNARIDRVVYGMSAAPDGGAWLADSLRKNGMTAPEIVSGIGETETVQLMRTFLSQNPDGPATPYVRELLRPYEHLNSTAR